MNLKKERGKEMREPVLTEDPCFVQFESYCKESEAIEKKLENPDVSEGKKDKLKFRLRLLKEKLIPQVVSNLHGNLP